jgi:hypothetical protein
MKRHNLAAIVICFVLAACGPSEKKDDGESFFPVLSFLRSQVADVDTTLNAIREYVSTDSSKTDTIFVHREQFRQLAEDFLSIPDLSKPEYKKRYREYKQFDETLNRALFTYTPVTPEKELIQKQEVLIRPDAGGDKITSIIINSVKNTKDSAVQKRMLWQVDRSFQVITIKQLQGQPEITTTVKVVWNEE